MKLYTDNKGRWAGTQADAKQLGDFEQVEVPTDKPNLLMFLNDNCVGGTNDNNEQPEIIKQKTHPLSCSANPNLWDVHDAILNCDRKYLGQALGSIISRIHDEMEEA